MKGLKIVFVYFLLVACVAPSSSDAQTVYITETGTKYHLASCQYLRKSQYEITMKEAVARGYKPCSVCEPGDLPEKQNATPDHQGIDEKSTGIDTTRRPLNPKPSVEKSGETTSRRCTATTKAGARCKRMTTNASGKCYQHE